MKYLTSAVSETGQGRKGNQDSACIKVAKTKIGDMAIAVICDGMGGLQKGEMASAAVLEGFERWFEEILPGLLSSFTLEHVADSWRELIEHENTRIRNYSLENEIKMGTTLTAMFFFQGQFLIAHVGDSRAYRLGFRRKRLTKDHTLVEREVESGILSREEAFHDKRKHILWQCVGASVYCEPEIIYGKVKQDEVFLLCTDGFYHLVSGMEICNAFASSKLVSERIMARQIKEMIRLAIERGEQDNISVVLVKAVGEN